MDTVISFENNIIQTKKLIIDFDTRGGLGTVYYNKLKEFSTRIVQIDAESGNFDTYESLLKKCIRTAIELKKRGIQKGHYVSLCSDQHLNAVIPIIASHMIGAIPYSVDPSMSQSDITHLFSLINPKIIFTIKSSQTNVEAAATITGIKSEIIVFNENFETEFLKLQDNEDSFVPYFAEDLKETATIYFSSGSTGLPKGICISHHALMRCYNSTIKQSNDHIVMYMTSKWYWISSVMFFFSTVVLGSTQILASVFNPTSLWQWTDKYNITKMFLSGYAFKILSSTEKPKDINISSLKTIITGGGPVPDEDILRMRSILPKTNVFLVYGMTEAGILAQFQTNNKLHEKMAREKLQGMGVTCGNSFRVVDTETNKVLGPNQPGELQVKTEKMMNGYYNANSSHDFVDGWFKTKDIVYYDEDFCLYYVNRINDIFFSCGSRVYPARLETILSSHPSVELAVVVGKPHKTDQNHATAVVKLKKDYEDKIKPKELENYVNNKVQDETQHLKGGVCLINDIPVTVTGKISRKKIVDYVLNNSLS